MFTFHQAKRAANIIGQLSFFIPLGTLLFVYTLFTVLFLLGPASLSAQGPAQSKFQTLLQAGKVSVEKAQILDDKGQPTGRFKFTLRHKRWDGETGEPISDYVEENVTEARVQHVIDNLQAQIDRLEAQKASWEDKLKEMRRLKALP